MSLGPMEILAILVVALVVFGPKRLPEVGRQVGAAMRELRKMQDQVRSELDTVMHPDMTPNETTSTAAAHHELEDEELEEPDHTTLPPPTADELMAVADDGFPHQPGSFT